MNKKFKNIKILSKNGRPGDTNVTLSDGTNLGLVQSINWSIELGGLSKCKIETIMSPAELISLQQNTEVTVIVKK